MPSTPSQWSDLRPTRRGVGALLVAGAAVALAWLFGARSLNAVAGPLLVAVAVGAVQLLVSPVPSVDRVVPEAGFPEESGTVEVTVGDGPTVVGVTESVPAGLAADATATVSPPSTVRYDLRYVSRGQHSLGPTTLRVRDVFGLVGYTTTAGGTDDVLVYPTVYDLGSSEALVSLLASRQTPERQAFDTVREYTPGDPLRDVHWKTSAKHDDELFVKEFSGREPTETLTVVASATEDTVDEMASAVASVALVVLEHGLPVKVILPAGTVSARPNHDDRRELLTTLSTVGHGRPDTDVEADVTVAGEEVTVGDRTMTFERLRADGATLSPVRTDDTREVTVQ